MSNIYGSGNSDVEYVSHLPCVLDVIEYQENIVPWPSRFESFNDIGYELPSELLDHVTSTFPEDSVETENTEDEREYFDSSKVIENLDIENEIDINEEDLDVYEFKTEELTKKLTDILMLSGIVPLISLDNGIAIAEAISRDGLGVSSEIEKTAAPIVSMLSEFKLLKMFLEELKISDKYADKIIDEFLPKRIETMNTNMNKASKSIAYTQKLRNLVAKSKKTADVTAVLKKMSDK